jgi:hypothetical protein
MGLHIRDLDEEDRKKGEITDDPNEHTVEHVAPQPKLRQPRARGFYRYSGGQQIMIFLLATDGYWYTIFDNGDMYRTEWGYIEQALGVYDLVKIKGDDN